jgi:hypothetical protein
MDRYNNLDKEIIPLFREEACINNQCSGKKENGFELCQNCIREYIRICTCNKTFITDKPKHYVLGKKNSVILVFDLPEEIPEFFYTHINGCLYHILGCRGCQHTKEISVKDNFKEALQASIVSCVYQTVYENDKHSYEYLSDSLDPSFENYATRQGIPLGEPTKISTGTNTSETSSTGPSIEIPFNQSG